MSNNGRLSAVLLERAVTRARAGTDGGRNDSGLWLACQLRDDGYREQDAETSMRQYATAVARGSDHEYAESEAISTLHSAFSRSAREPWTDNRTKPQPANKQEHDPPKPQFDLELLNSEQFSAADYRLEWRVKRILVHGQPCMFGGPRKALKTSMLIDLAISLGNDGCQFLNKFKVPNAVKVGMLSGESGAAMIQETARRIAVSKGVTLSGSGVWWGFALPQLSRLDHLDAVAAAIEVNKLDVLILDPAYLCLLTGNTEAQALRR